MTESFLKEALPYSFYQSVLIKWSRLENDLVDPERKLNEYSIELGEIASTIGYEIERWVKTKIDLADKDTQEDIFVRVTRTLGGGRGEPLGYWLTGHLLYYAKIN